MGFIDKFLGIFGKKKTPPKRRSKAQKSGTAAVRSKGLTESTPVVTKPAAPAPPVVVRKPKTAPVRQPRKTQDAAATDPNYIKQKEMELRQKEQAFIKELEDEWVRRELELKKREEELMFDKQKIEQERLDLATKQLSAETQMPAGPGQQPSQSLLEYEKKIAEFETREEELRKREEILRRELESLKTEPGGDFRVELQKREEELEKREREMQKRAEELDIDEMMRNIEEKMKEEVTEPLKEYVFENFVIGDSNRFAFEVSIAVARAPADSYNPLFLYSDVGMGKTHLLNAIGNYIKEQHPDMKIVYVSCEKFTNELINYLQYGKIEEFRDKYRTVDVLLIDDIQFIALQQSTQEEFFHTFNTLYNSHKQIVLASDRPPKDIQHLEARLRSRFEGGLIVNIKVPDLNTRKNILEHKALEAGITLDPRVSDFIARYIQADVRTLIGSLNNILAHSSLTGRQIDLTLVSEVLKSMWPESMTEVA